MIRPLLDAGKMPHLQRLIAAGVSGNLATLQPVLSPMLWTSIATGKRADKHGILGFVEPDPASVNGVRPVTNLSRKTKAVWNILSQCGRRCNVVGWWPSFPAEPIRGVMVSNRLQTAVAGLDEPWPMLPGTVHPERLAENLEPLRLHPLEVTGDTLLPFVPRAAEIDQKKDRRLLGLAKTVAETATVHAAATGVLQLEPWDFMAVYYDGLDHFGHGFMKYHPPRRAGIAEEDCALYGGVMEAAYRYHDLMLGVLLDLAGPDTRVLLLSDHGFHPDHLRPQSLPGEPAGPAVEHRDYGIFVMAGPGIRQGGGIAGSTLLDIAPTILHAFGLAVGEDMDGKVLLPVFAQPQAVARIPSWDAVPGEAGTHPPDARIDAQSAVGALRQLVDLGYIEEPDADRAVAAEEAARELRYHLAQSLMDGGRFPEAAGILHDLWERWPEESRFGLKLLHCRLALRQGALARELFGRLRERRLATAEKAREEKAAFLAEKKAAGAAAIEDWPEADQRRLERLQMRSTTDAAALVYFEAQVIFEEGDFERAHALFAGLVAEAPPDRSLSLRLKLGETSFQLRRWDEARAEFAHALELDADNAAAHLGLARTLLYQKRVIEAAAHGLKAVELDYHNPRTHFIYGVALHRCGHPAWAADAFLEAVRQAPLFPGAHRRLAGLYAGALRDPERAARHRELALRAVGAITEQGAPAAVVIQQGGTPRLRLCRRENRAGSTCSEKCVARRRNGSRSSPACRAPALRCSCRCWRPAAWRLSRMASARRTPQTKPAISKPSR